MKVLVLSNLYPPDVIGGYEIVCRQVVDFLRGRGHDVLVLTSIPRAPVEREPHVRRTLRLANLWDASKHARGEQALRQVEAASGLINAANVYALTTVLDDFEPDVVHVANVVGLGGLGMVACLQQKGVPWVWHLSDNVPSDLCRVLDRFRPALARQLGKPSRVRFISCSNRLAGEVEETTGLSLAGRVDVVPNWIEGERPAPRSRYYRAGEPLRVVAAGRVNPDKGIDLLIEAVARLKARGRHNVSLDIYGGQIEVGPRYYPEMILRFGVGDRVRLMGTRTHAEMCGLYADYDVLAFPTWEREPFGLSPLEAGALGCVPLISENCGLAEWLVHGMHCLKLERSAEGLETAFRAILDGDVDLAPIGRRVAAVAWRDFHVEAVMPRIEGILEEAARPPRGVAGSSAEAYRLALLAEALTKVVVHHSHKVGR